jgi:metal-responsive CopG/Arc/MetJ family transcriptional regulator
MATLDSIADEIGYTRNELMQSMVKFGLTNRDWRNEGLTAHKRLPRYQENPGMIPKLRRHVGSYAVVEIKTGQVVGELFKDSKLLDKVNFDKYKLVPIDEWLASLSRKENPIMATRTPTPAQLAARARFAEMARSGVLNRKRKTAAKKKAAAMPLAANPRKKTVSQKISQLVHEGYPQKQAIAVALNEQRAGKVKRNPSRAAPKSSTVYVVEYSKDGSRWDTWMKVMYLDMAKAIAQRLADDPFHKNHYIRVESIREVV